MILDYAAQFEAQARLAHADDREGQFRLAVMYTLGLGVAQSYVQALKWYLEAARNGSTSAQSNLGFMYGTGRGVPQDFVEAHAWYSIAASSGNETARKNRDSLMREMSPKQIEEAQKLAKRHFATLRFTSANLADPGAVLHPLAGD